VTNFSARYFRQIFFLRAINRRGTLEAWPPGCRTRHGAKPRPVPLRRLNWQIDVSKFVG
jgi:hypothetical protein